LRVSRAEFFINTGFVNTLQKNLKIVFVTVLISLKTMVLEFKFLQDEEGEESEESKEE